ncbi:nuclear transport factor 2 family protein [Pedobacter sp. L105]|uniref:nuclear transport factor 2 family protein n=1 Tax=Pedobacter sp. L105 TaxID=1641871 RepID=UPI00131CCA4C|nr:nuclear transport factor 2 family protein [Pedobacter sp. L105]
MKKLSIVLLILITGLLANAQSKDETNVASAVEKLRLAMISGNKADLESVLSDELTYGHSSGKIQTKEEFVKAISTKESDFLDIQLTGQQIKVTGDIAVVNHTLTANTNDGGKPGTVRLGIVLVWKKIKGDWKLIGRRAFKVPA